jgi:hypothetical protein
MNEEPKRFYESGPFHLDPHNRVLARGGEPIPLPPKVSLVHLSPPNYPPEAPARPCRASGLVQQPYQPAHARGASLNIEGGGAGGRPS